MRPDPDVTGGQFIVRSKVLQHLSREYANYATEYFQKALDRKWWHFWKLSRGYYTDTGDMYQALAVSAARSSVSVQPVTASVSPPSFKNYSRPTRFSYGGVVPTISGYNYTVSGYSHRNGFFRNSP